MAERRQRRTPPRPPVAPSSPPHRRSWARSSSTAPAGPSTTSRTTPRECPGATAPVPWTGCRWLPPMPCRPPCPGCPRSWDPPSEPTVRSSWPWTGVPSTRSKGTAHPARRTETASRSTAACGPPSHRTGHRWAREPRRPPRPAATDHRGDIRMTTTQTAPSRTSTPVLGPITHVALTVQDLDVSLLWYAALIGSAPVLDEDTGPFRHTVFAVGGTLLSLHSFPEGIDDQPFS